MEPEWCRLTTGSTYIGLHLGQSSMEQSVQLGQTIVAFHLSGILSVKWVVKKVCATLLIHVKLNDMKKWIEKEHTSRF